MQTIDKRTSNFKTVFNEIYEFPNTVEYFDQIKQVNPIPKNSIIYKTVTGIGATFSEIKAKRHSIIVLPHISIVTSKNDKHQIYDYTMAVYGDITVKDIIKHLKKDFEFLKILTTPKGMDKIILALSTLTHESRYCDYKQNIFILIDECHKFIKDSQYRADMVDVMEHFFEFANKAMVSATPIAPTDPRFKEQNFRNIKVTPDFTIEANCEMYIPKINLKHTNSIASGLKEYIETNDAEHYCIFFNSLDGIKELIDKLKLKNQHKIFCSNEGVTFFKLNTGYKAENQFTKLEKYNFFTSSFFNGLDIKTDCKPDIIILTDYGYRKHTLLDPYTDILQIIGRFRKKDDRSHGYSKITHINNASKYPTPISEEEAISKFEVSRGFYELLTSLNHATGKDEFQIFFDQAMSTVKPFYNLLTTVKKFSYFLYDKYLYHERVKNYYKNPSCLYNAYIQTRLFEIVGNDRKEYEKGEMMKLELTSSRYAKEKSQMIINTLVELEEFKFLDIFYQVQEKISKISPIIFDAYNRLGVEVIELLKYNKRKIEIELMKLDIEEGKNSFPMIDLIYSNFFLNRKYTRDQIKKTLLKIYEDFGLGANAVATDLERYFEFASRDSKKGGDRAYVFTGHKFNPVTKQKNS